MIHDNNFEVNVTGQDSIRLFLKDDVTVLFTFTIKARANMCNLLDGKNVAELSTAPRTTGLPQLDLIRSKKPSAFGLKLKKLVKKIVRKRPSPVKRRSGISMRRRPIGRGFLCRRR